MQPAQADLQLTSDAPAWQKLLGAGGLFIGVFSLGWLAVGRPEFGGSAERIAYFFERLSNQRVFGGFLVDLGIYWLAQALLMHGAGAPKQYYAVPFFGLGAWLTAGRPVLR
jgi:hypothetical protein